MPNAKVLSFCLKWSIIVQQLCIKFDNRFETREYEGDYISFLWCSSEKTGDYEVASWIDSIGPKAFLNSKLDSVTLGEKIDYIWEDAFENCPNLVIKAPEGSYAIEFAKENGLKFEEITY